MCTIVGSVIRIITSSSVDSTTITANVAAEGGPTECSRSDSNTNQVRLDSHISCHLVRRSDIAGTSCRVMIACH
jgi:hypothetical protein